MKGNCHLQQQAIDKLLIDVVMFQKDNSACSFAFVLHTYSEGHGLYLDVFLSAYPNYDSSCDQGVLLPYSSLNIF